MKKQKLKINTNKMFNAKFVRAYLNECPELAKQFKEISFKKKAFKDSDLIFADHSIQVSLDKKRKLSVYVVPYTFYSNSINGYIQKDNRKEHSYSYYNFILKNVLYAIDEVMIRICNRLKDDYGLIQTCPKRLPKLISTFRNINYPVSANKFNLIIEKYKKEDNTNIYKDLGGVIAFKSKQVSKELKRNYLQSLNTNSPQMFNPSLAKFNRLRWTGFKGTFTISDLKEKVLGNLNIMSDYSFKDMADKIATPVIYQSAFRPRKYRFYTMEHVKQMKKTFGRVITDEKYKCKKMEKDIRALSVYKNIDEHPLTNGGDLIW